MNQGKFAGEALRRVLEVLENKEVEDNTKYKNEGCLNCIYYTKEEGYNQAWGTFQFYNCYCTKGIKKVYLNSECESFKFGDNTLVYMSNKEKKKIQDYLGYGTKN